MSKLRSLNNLAKNLNILNKLPVIDRPEVIDVNKLKPVVAQAADRVRKGLFKGGLQPHEVVGTKEARKMLFKIDDVDESPNSFESKHSGGYLTGYEPLEEAISFTQGLEDYAGKVTVDLPIKESDKYLDKMFELEAKFGPGVDIAGGNTSRIDNQSTSLGLAAASKNLSLRDLLKKTPDDIDNMTIDQVKSYEYQRPLFKSQLTLARDPDDGKLKVLTSEGHRELIKLYEKLTGIKRPYDF